MPTCAPAATLIAELLPDSVLFMIVGSAVLEIVIRALRSVTEGPLLLGPLFAFAIALSDLASPGLDKPLLGTRARSRRVSAVRARRMASEPERDAARSALMQGLGPGMLPGVAEFAVIPSALEENARQLVDIEPFTDLAAASLSLTGLPSPPRTAEALEALVARSAEALMSLSVRTRAIANSTMSSAVSYEAIEGSILRSLTSFPSR